MPLIVLRCVFLIVAMGISGLLIRLQLPAEGSDGDGSGLAPWITFILVMALAGLVILLDVFLPSKRIDTISSVYFGMLIGLILTALVSVALTPLRQIFQAQYVAYIDSGILFLGGGMCYLCISFLLQTKDDFRFIIPYVEFSKEVKGLRPYVLDTSAVIDGRIADVVETNLMDNQLIMPRFVLAELQGIADSSDKLRRSRGRRGLDILNKLQNSDGVDLQIYDRELKEFAGQPVDMKLVLLAKHIEGKVVTGDYNLNKVARLHNVQVINLNDLANALKPVYMPGEKFVIRIVKPGESADQGVGYLDDGTMIVVQDGRDYINKNVEVTVTSVLQTSAGRMIFSRFERVVEDKKKKNA